jgi:hypothetical protein
MAYKLNDALFAATIPHERKITCTLLDGTVVEQAIYVRELTALELRRQVLAEQSDDQGRVEKALATLIAAAICDENGNPVMTAEQAGRLKPLVGKQMRDLIMEVSGMGKPTAPAETTPG